LEFGSKNNIDNIPFWAWYSDYNQTFMWRDLYSLGFIDSDGIGVDYPFINGAHYPYSQVLLLQKPIQRETEIVTTIINQPTTDDCE
jgi:hypothetical protein